MRLVRTPATTSPTIGRVGGQRGGRWRTPNESLTTPAGTWVMAMRRRPRRRWWPGSARRRSGAVMPGRCCCTRSSAWSVPATCSPDWDRDRLAVTTPLRWRCAPCSAWLSGLDRSRRPSTWGGLTSAFWPGLGPLPNWPRCARVSLPRPWCDPLAVLGSLTRGVIATAAPPEQVFFIDDHFVPYYGAAPVAKGWNTFRVWLNRRSAGALQGSLAPARTREGR